MAMVALLGVLLALSAGLARCSDPGFDLFVLVRSYSPTFCKETPCTITPISAFTIHGLWPEYNTGGWPEFCDNRSSNTRSDGAARRRLRMQPPLLDGAGSALSGHPPLRKHHAAKEVQEQGGTSSGSGAGSDELDLEPEPPEPPEEPEEGGVGSSSAQQQCEWPSFKGTNAGFWQHEWSRHGTCARPVTGNRPEFFQIVMRLHEQYDLDEALAGAGIEPSETQLYFTRKVALAIEDAFGVLPMLSCHKGALLEVWLCVGLNLKVQQCPSGVVRAQNVTCGRTIKLPQGAPVPSECKSYFPPWDAPNSTGGNLLFVRIATGLAVAGAGAAAAAMFWSGMKGRSQYRLLSSIPEERYDPLQSWP